MENYVPQRKIGAIPGHLTKELKVSLQPSEEDGQQRRKARRNEAAGDEPDKTRDGTVGKQQKGCSKKEKGRKEKQKAWMAWDGQQVTRLGKRNQKLSCA